MSAKMQMRLVGSRPGRVVIHLVAMAKDLKFGWHMLGICREFKEAMGT